MVDFKIDDVISGKELLFSFSLFTRADAYLRVDSVDFVGGRRRTPFVALLRYRLMYLKCLIPEAEW